MSSSDLLAQLVARRGLQPEPVATDALVHILSTSGAARSGVANLATSICPEGEFGTLVYSGQSVAAEQEGRPDIVGSDTSGSRLLIEAKFGAELTAAQAGKGYLDWLPSGQPGLLIYLVPANRLPAIWPELLQGPCEVEEVDPPDLAHADAPWLVHPVGDGRMVAATSWEGLLKTLHGAMDGTGDPGAIADLVQLDGLVHAQVQSGWVPVIAGDLPSRAGPQLWGLSQALVQAASAVSVTRITNATQDIGPGRWITTAGGHSFRLGIHLEAWAALGMSPLWATVWETNVVRLDAIGSALSGLNAAGQLGAYLHGDRTWGSPIRTPQGAEIGTVTAEISRHCTRFAELLDTLPADLDAATVPTGSDSGDASIPPEA